MHEGARAEDAQVGHIWHAAKEQLPRRLVLASHGRAVAQQVGGEHRLAPQSHGQASVGQHAACLLQQGAVESLRLAVLLRSVGHGGLRLDALGLEVGVDGAVDVLAAVVGAHGLDGQARLVLQVAEGAADGVGHVVLALEQLDGSQTSVVIQEGADVDVARQRWWQRPAEVHVYQLQGLGGGAAGRLGEGQPGLLALETGLAGACDCLEVCCCHVDAADDGWQARHVVVAEVTKAPVPQLGGLLDSWLAQEGADGCCCAAADDVHAIDELCNCQYLPIHQHEAAAAPQLKASTVLCCLPD